MWGGGGWEYVLQKDVLDTMWLQLSLAHVLWQAAQDWACQRFIPDRADDNAAPPHPKELSAARGCWKTGSYFFQWCSHSQVADVPVNNLPTMLM